MDSEARAKAATDVSRFCRPRCGSWRVAAGSRSLIYCLVRLMMEPDEARSNSGDGSQPVIRIPDPVVVRDLVEKLQVPAPSVIAALMDFN